MQPPLIPLAVLWLSLLAEGFNFQYETVQLTDAAIRDFPDIAFAENNSVPLSASETPCRAFPGSQDWPTEAKWSRLNASLHGALLQPHPPASVCYAGSSYDAAACSFLLGGVASTSFYLDDPLTVLTQWPEGNTCLPSLSPEGNCTRGGFPVYVVNATTVEHIQIAVNFARNNNLRLVIK